MCLIDMTITDKRWLDLKDLPNEEWKDIEGYENIYQISNYGRVKSLERINYYGYHIKNKILKSSIDKYGYCRIYLTKKSKTKSKLIHRLVGNAFICNPNNLPEINHKDERKQNNKVDNLEWCTHLYNSNYGTRVSKIIPKTIEKTRKIIAQYDMEGNLIKIWNGMNYASRTLNITQQNISKCCRNERKTAGGFIWKYYQTKRGD